MRLAIKIFTLINLKLKEFLIAADAILLKTGSPKKFDHNKTNFSLEGAHHKVECAGCHPKVELNGNTFIKFKLDDFKCAACHKK